MSAHIKKWRDRLYDLDKYGRPFERDIEAADAEIADLRAALHAQQGEAPPKGWYATLDKLHNNTETFGDYSQETARVAIECCMNALEELEAEQQGEAKDVCRSDSAQSDPQRSLSLTSEAKDVQAPDYRVVLWESIRQIPNIPDGVYAQIKRIIHAAPTPATLSDERTNFVRCSKLHGWVDAQLVQNSIGEYPVGQVQSAWEGWQARALLVAAGGSQGRDAQSAILQEICDMQKRHYGDGVATHLALIELCDKARAAIDAAMETK